MHEHRWDTGEEKFGFDLSSWVVLGEIHIATAWYLVGVLDCSPASKVLGEARHSRECSTIALAIRPHLVARILPPILLPEVRLTLSTTEVDLEAFTLVVAISSESVDGSGRVTDVECDRYCGRLDCVALRPFANRRRPHLIHFGVGCCVGECNVLGVTIEAEGG